MQKLYVAALGRHVYVRPRTADDEVYRATFEGLYHVPPAITPERVLDLGSNIGFTVAHYAVMWPQAKIIGVEMALDLVAAAYKNTDVPILPVAVGTVNGVARFHHNGDWGTRHHLDANGNAQCDVWTIPKIAQVCFDGQEIDFCKMDVEGEEWHLFAHPEWAPYVKHLLVELHANGDPKTLKERGLRALDAIGFDASIHEIHPHALWAVRR